MKFSRALVTLLGLALGSCGPHGEEWEIVVADTTETDPEPTDTDDKALASDTTFDTDTILPSDPISEDCIPDADSLLPLPCSCEVSPPCLLAHWAFEGNASDELGFFHGEEMNDVNYLIGPSGKAVDLGSDGGGKAHVRVTSDAENEYAPGTLNPSNVSVTFWVRRSIDRADNNVGQIIERGRPCMNYWGCTMGGSDLTCGFNPGHEWCSGINELTATIDPDIWHHVVFTLERLSNDTRAYLRLYINGVLASARNLSGEFPNDVADQKRYLVLGRNYIDPEGGDLSIKPWYGQLDDLRIYEGVLTAAQIFELYTSY